MHFTKSTMEDISEVPIEMLSVVPYLNKATHILGLHLNFW